MPEYDKWAEKICHIYIAQPVKKRSEPLEPGHTALWLSWIDAVNMVASEGDRAFLLNLR
jgi:8-oxo-dGTP diphosphatase